MSEAAIAALAKRAGGASPDEDTPSSKAIAALEQRAQGKTFGEPSRRVIVANDRMRGDPGSDPARPIGGLETALHTVTGLAGTAVGGTAGIGSLLMGRGADSAADTVNWWQQALTYQPRTPEGESGTRAFASGYNPLTWPGRVGEFAGEKAEEAGWWPGISTAMRMTPEVITALVGAPGAPKNIGASVTQDIGAMGRAAKRTVFGEEPTPTEFGADSLSAAAASRINAAKDISPELLSDLREQVRHGPLKGEAVDRQIDADSLPVRMRLTEGQASQEPSLLSNERNARGRDPALAARYNEQNQQLIDNLDAMRADVAPQAVAHDPVQSGQNIIDAYKQYDDTVRADIDAKYQALRDAAGGDFPVNGKAFVEEADRALKKQMKGRYVPAEIAADMAELRDGGSMTFEQFENMRTNLAAASRKAERAGDGNAAAAVSTVREALESLPLEGGAAGLKPLADAARTAAKARFDRMRADPAYKAAVEDDVGIGEASSLADKFVEKYIVKGRAAHLQRMLDTLGGDQLAAETIRASGLNYMKQRAGIDPYTSEGNFSQAGYNKALAEITPKLEMMVGPEMAEQLQRLGRVARSVQAQPAGSFVNNSNTFVAAASEAAKGSLEGAANVAAGGVPVGTWTRKIMQGREAARASRDRLRPAAGVRAGEKQ